MTGPVVRGAEPFSHHGGPFGVLVCHGFTGTPQSMRPIADALASAGFTVEAPLWPGHGTAIDDMVGTRWDDWSSAADDAYRRLARACPAGVAVVGLSMGGTLACWLAERHPELRGLVLVNPMVAPADPGLVRLAEEAVSAGSATAPGIGSDIAREGAQEICYDETPLEAFLSLNTAAAEVGAALGRIRCPVLLISSRQDHIVPPATGDAVVDRVEGEVERVWFERSYHVATLDLDGPEAAERSVAFVRGVAGGS